MIVYILFQFYHATSAEFFDRKFLQTTDDTTLLKDMEKNIQSQFFTSTAIHIPLNFFL